MTSGILAGTGIGTGPVVDPNVVMVISIGNSNEKSNSVQAPLPPALPVVATWLNFILGGVNYTTPHPLAISPDTTSNWSINGMKVISDSGRRCGLIQCSRGSSAMLDWTPGQSNFDSELIPTLTLAISQLEDAFPGIETVTWLGGVNLGEVEVTEVSESPSALWGTRFGLYKAGIESFLGTSVWWQANQTANVAGANWLTTINTQQIANSSDAIDTSDATFNGDNLHFNYQFQSILGTRRGDSYVAYLDAP